MIHNRYTSWFTLYFLLSLTVLMATLLTAGGQMPDYIPILVHRPAKVVMTGRPGIASWLVYTRYDTCAARDWPKGTRLLVSTPTRSITCVVRDYGPDLRLHPDRIVDLNAAQFEKLAPTSKGLINVNVLAI